MSLSPRIRLRVLPSALPVPSALSIGTVTAGAAAASITGDPPNQVLNLVLQAGPANSLAIGTVTQGAAAASITGTPPAQTLNLTLPPGNAATIAVGSVTAVANTDPATVTNVGTSVAAIFNFQIPAGVPGSVADGNKKYVTVSAGGTVWTVNYKGFALPLTPYDLVADPTTIGVGSAAADTAALQAFFDYIAVNEVAIADWSGNWSINAPIDVGVPDEIAVVTMTIATPGVVTLVGHGKADGDPIRFNTSGALPTGATAGTQYYVKSPLTDTFNFAASPGGAAINTTGSQSGTHYAVFPGADSLTKQIVGDIELTPTVAMDQVMTIWNSDHTHFGNVRINGGGQTIYANKTVGHGVVNRSSSRIEMGTIYADYLRGFAYTQTQRLGENDNTNTIGVVKAFFDGSGIIAAANAANLTATFTGYTHPVTADNVTQRTQLAGVSAFPPSYITDPFYGSSPPNGGHLFVVIGGLLYLVMAIDSGAGTVDVHPRIVPFATAAGSLDWIFGGGVNARGGDSNNLTVKRVDAVNSAIGLADNALYGVNAGELQAQGCGIIWSFGLPLASSTHGGNVQSIYSESNNWFEVVQVSAQTAGNNFHQLFNQKTPLNMAEWINVAKSIANGTALPVVTLNKWVGLGFQRNGIFHSPETFANNGEDAQPAVTADMSDPRTSWFKFPASTRTINITAAATGLNNITGRQGKTVFIAGTGSNGAVTGTLTFSPPGGATVNGGASAVFVHSIGASAFFIYHEVASNNYVVSQIGGVMKDDFATLTDAATIAVDLRNSRLFTVTLTASRAMGAPSNLATAAGMPVEFVVNTGAGSFTLSWNAAYVWPAATAPTLTLTPSRHDIFLGRVNSAGTAIDMRIGGQNYT